LPDIQWETISRTIKDRAFQTLAEARITSEYFSEDNVPVFEWVRNHWTKYGESPSEQAYYHEFPADLLVETPEPMAYYVDELRESYRYFRIIQMLDTIKEPLDNHDTAIVLKLLAGGVQDIHTDVVELLDAILTDTKAMEDRMTYYDNLATQTGLLGWPTGFSSMDQATGGLQKGQLITLVGIQKVKKSMLLMVMNIAAHKAGARTLFASFEMTNIEQSTRHDALRANISLTRLQRGQHNLAERRKLIATMHELEDMQPLVLIHDPAGTTTVSAIAAKIALHQPDVVFIDGTYMMDPEINAERNSAQALTSITRSLKRLAQRAEIPIVQTTQALTWKSRKGLTLDSIGYSSSFAQDSDVIFGVEEVKGEGGEASDRELLLRIIASRNCPRQDVRLSTMLEYGTITEADDVKFESDDDDDRGSAGPYRD
jgi:replicative DNA helicase